MKARECLNRDGAFASCNRSVSSALHGYDIGGRSFARLFSRSVYTFIRYKWTGRVPIYNSNSRFFYIAPVLRERAQRPTRCNHSFVDR